MAKVALLIGTGEYSRGFQPLPAAPRDVMALEAMLRNSELGGFDSVETLIDPLHSEMAIKLEIWFRKRTADDLVLLYISGHGIKSVQRELFFAATDTRKEREELVTATAVSARFVHDCIRLSKAKRQILVLDCCFSGAFGDLLVKDDGSIDLTTAFGAEGRVVLTSSSSTEYSFEQRDGKLSIYTSYLVEGIETGAADFNSDGLISIAELHQYASQRVREASPNMNPKIIVLNNEGYNLNISKAPMGDPRARYRKAAGAIAEEDEGEISFINRQYLNELQAKIGITSEEAQQIEFDVLQPYRLREIKITRYQEIFAQIVEQNYPLNEKQIKALQRFQVALSLRDEDIKDIESKIFTSNKLHEKEDLSNIADSSKKQDSAISSSDIKASQSSSPTDEKESAQEPHIADPRHEYQSEELLSESGLNYKNLENLLVAEKWQDADIETHSLMMQASGKTESDEFESDELLTFPCLDLKTINSLWVKHSNGKFGFSIQKKIYLGCGGKPTAKQVDCEVWERFTESTGWCSTNAFDGTELILYSEAIFDISAPAGHLPFGVFLWSLDLYTSGTYTYIDLGGAFFSRLTACRIL